MNHQMIEQDAFKLWLSLLVRMSLFAAALMWPAGTWRWWEAWVMVGLWTVFGVLMTRYLMHRDPALLTERLKLLPLHRDQKTWDKLLMTLFFIFGIALYLIPGFDVVRYGWSDSLPMWMKAVALLVHIPCFFGLGWVMRENTFLAQVVKIDVKRGHKVITTGPYALVRHPMYTIVIILLFAVPVALGSRYALILAALLSLLLILRTYLEDCALHEELDGYADYAQITRYRLFPGIW